MIGTSLNESAGDIVSVEVRIVAKIRPIKTSGAIIIVALSSLLCIGLIIRNMSAKHKYLCLNYIVCRVLAIFSMPPPNTRVKAIRTNRTIPRLGHSSLKSRAGRILPL